MNVQPLLRRPGGLSAVACAWLIAIVFGSLPAIASAQLLGDSSVDPAPDNDPAGMAEAFQVTAASSGTLNTLHIYLDSSSKATKVVLGLYSDGGGNPGTLLVQSSTATPAAGAWNAITVAPTQVTAGVTYWIALLGTGGTVAFRDHCCGGGTPAQNSSQANLTSLPGSWSQGARWSDGGTSVYGSSNTAPPPPPSPTPDQVGSWSSLMSWPLVAAHSILMPNGKLLLMDGWVAPNPTQLFDPVTNTLTSMINPFGRDIFCSGHTTLPDGRVLIAGGHGFTNTIGIDATSLFDPVTNHWSAGPAMSFARWYPTLTELGDGRLVAISGNITQTTWADTPEIYDPTTNTWRVISGVNTSQVHEEEYPLSFLLPSGKIFTIASSAARSYVLDPIAPSWSAVGGATLYNGSAVMYLPGKILYSGGGTPLDSATPALATAQTIDLTAANPIWMAAGTMNTARYAHTLVVLPDGKVLAVGGGANLDQQDLVSAPLSLEEWDPTSGQWTLLASMAVPRVYHSTAVLLPDGRVLVAGGGHADGTSSPAEYNAQYYSPPYLFKGARPSITAAPTNATYGSVITIGTPDAASIASVVLISLAADTHTLDMSGHFVPLTFTANSGQLSANIPSSSSLVPPGYYMLFVVNSAGVPAVAPFIQIAGSAPVVTITAPAAGQQVSGTAVTLSANASDPTGIRSVQFTVDGSPLGSAVTVAPYTTPWNSTTVGNGTHSIGANATNVGGATASASPVSVTVSNATGGGNSPSTDVVLSAEGAGTQTTARFNTTVPGDVLVAFAGSDGPGNTAQTLTISGAGLAWQLVKRVNARGGTTEIWTATAAAALTNVNVTSTQSVAGYSQSLTVVAFRNAKGIGASVTASAVTGAPTVNLTATAAGSLVYGAGNDYDRAISHVPGSGQAIVHQWLDAVSGDSYWVQNRTAPIAGAGSVVAISDTAPTTDRWNLAAVEIVPP
jgi:hypothetical protein